MCYVTLGYMLVSQWLLQESLAPAVAEGRPCVGHVTPCC